MSADQRDQSFRRWLDQWLRQLLKRCQHGDVRTLLKLITVSQRFDTSLMLFVLPHSLLQAITAPDPQPEASRPDAEAVEICPGGTAACAAILAEIAAVVAACRPRHAPISGSIQIPDAAMHLQAIVSAMDTISKWHHLASAEISDFESARKPCGRGKDRNVAPLTTDQIELIRKVAAVGRFQDLLLQDEEGSVNLKELALASHWCGAEARALRYYEIWLRSCKGPLINETRSDDISFSDNEVTTLMNIYKGLEDPDGVTGLVTIRSTGPTNADWILAAEKAGRWDDASALYEVEMAGHSVLSGPQVALSRAAESVQAPAAPLGTAGICGVPDLVEGYLRSMLASGKPQLLVSVAEGLLQQAGEDPSMCRHAGAAGVAAAWRLCRWSSVEHFLQVIEEHGGRNRLSDGESWEAAIGHILFLCNERRLPEASILLDTIQMKLAAQMGPAGMESYERAHPLMIKLHMLQDLKQTGPQAMMLRESQQALKEKLDFSMQRIDTTASDVEARSAMLALVRSLAHLHDLPEVAASTWLPQVKVCRAMTQSDAAKTAVLEAERAGIPGAFIARAKLLWDDEEHAQAMDVLRNGIATLEIEPSDDDNMVKHRAQLKLLSWSADQGLLATLEVSSAFQKEVARFPEDDKTHLQYAMYLDKLYEDSRSRQRRAAGFNDEREGDFHMQQNMQTSDNELTYITYVEPLMQHYGWALRYGSKRVFQALPRMLTIYFEFGSDAAGLAQMASQAKDGSKDSSPASVRMLQSTQQAIQQKEGNVHATFDLMRKEASPGSLLAAIAQSISRIAHEHRPTCINIQRMVACVAKAHPNHCLWMLAAVRNSKAQERRKAAGTVQRHLRDRTDEKVRLIMEAHERVCTELQNFAEVEIPVPKTKQAGSLPPPTLIAPHFPKLWAAFPSPVMIPTLQAFENVSAASQGIPESALDGIVTMAAMDNEVTVMQSVCKPKRFQFLGSDGHRYRFLAKPKDDMRRDMRVIEYGSLLNRLLDQDAEAARRSMRLRTFMCVPLSESEGLVEWVHNTRSLRGIVCQCYTAKRITHAIDKKVWDAARVRTTSGSDRDGLLKWLKSMYKIQVPVMHSWWLARFSEPAAWLQARLNFTRSAATWSIAGHVVGLGDRHGDNVLIDESSGAVVHVDFGCLFDKGLTLPVKELVPFRLTQNMVDSMGVTGTEGGFRRSCVVALKVLRCNRQVLMSIMQAIVHDPFLDWANNTKTQQTTTKMGAKGAKGKSTPTNHVPGAHIGKQALHDIDGRLLGVLAGAEKRRCVQMTVQGQVDHLIREAQNPRLLCLMWIGWTPTY